MYNEIYKGILNLFNQDKDDMPDMRRIPHYLNMAYDFEPLDIVNVVDVPMPNNISDFVLILGNTPDGSPNTKYSEPIIMDGELKEMVLFNLTGYMSDNLETKIVKLVQPIYHICTCINKYIVRNIDETPYTMTHLINVLYYAPMILSVKTIDRLIDGVEAIDIAAALSAVYGTKISPTTIDSARYLLSESTITDVLDNSLLVGVSEDAYPDLLFVPSDNTDEESNDEKADNV